MSHLILVLGCHRSGTSVVARAMQCLGASLGPRAEWSAPDNPRGFWEDQDALAINDAILRLGDSAWHDPAPPRLDDTEQPIKIIAALLRNRLASYPLFALKEPRLCRLLPLYRKAIATVGCKVSVVHVIRHPGAVAASLLRRNGIPVERGLMLWLEYTARQFADVDPAWPSVTVGYDQAMTLPQDTVTRIGAALGLPVNRAAALLFARDFVDHSLWHDDAGDTALPVEMAAAWELAMKRTNL